jgi:hypothetical protein
MPISNRITCQTERARFWLAKTSSYMRKEWEVSILDDDRYSGKIVMFEHQTGIE